MAGKKQTFTQLLLLQIRAHFEHLAKSGNIPDEHRDAFYAASRDIRRNTPKFVQEARRQMDWQNAVEANEGATNVR